MQPISTQLKIQLRGQAMSLKPSVFVGKTGVSPAVIAAMEQQFTQRPLVKVRWSPRDKAAKAEVVSQLETANNCTCVGQVGHTASFYRPLPDPANT
jgi:RNA-binding protein